MLPSGIRRRSANRMAGGGHVVTVHKPAVISALRTRSTRQNHRADVLVNRGMAANQPGEPQHRQDDHHEDEGPAEPAAAIAVIAIVPASATQQENEYDDDKKSPHCRYFIPWTALPHQRS